VHFLIMQEFVNKPIMQRMSNMTVDTNIFDIWWRLIEKARFFSLVLDVILTTDYYG
jgi:hypothetical protein